MNEKILYQASLGMVIIGLVFLFFYGGEISTENIEKELIPGKNVIMHGKVSSIQTQDKAIFLTMLHEKVEPVTIILFEDEEISLQKGDTIEVTGMVEEYNGKSEIIAHKVVRK